MADMSRPRRRLIQKPGTVLARDPVGARAALAVGAFATALTMLVGCTSPVPSSSTGAAQAPSRSPSAATVVPSPDPTAAQLHGVRSIVTRRRRRVRSRYPRHRRRHRRAARPQPADGRRRIRSAWSRRFPRACASTSSTVQSPPTDTPGIRSSRTAATSRSRSAGSREAAATASRGSTRSRSAVTPSPPRPESLVSGEPLEHLFCSLAGDSPRTSPPGPDIAVEGNVYCAEADDHWGPLSGPEWVDQLGYCELRTDRGSIRLPGAPVTELLDGPSGPVEGRYAIVGHFDDPGARECRADGFEAGEPPHPAEVVLRMPDVLRRDRGDAALLGLCQSENGCSSRCERAAAGR